MIRAVAIGLILVIIPLLLFQRHLLYHPRPYAADDPIPQPLERLGFTTTDGAQAAWWRAPLGNAGATPQRVWLVFSGNAGTAWDWVGLRSEPVGPVGILLIDWPGFGASQGTPSPASILRAADGAVATLAAKLGLPVEDLCRRCGVLGHSMGAAAALHYAEQRGAVAVVLVAPFTSLLAMAQRAVGWPLCELLLHRFDNASALAALAQRPDKPPVLILHGDADTTIPLAMSRTLAAAHPGWVKLIAVPGAAHDDVLDLAWTTLRSALSMPQPTNDLPTAPPTTNP
ncbi:alpha/beta hydrolase [Planctomycetota bacterium]|nr:alpha/beta hydrolase [Planctomycetota bacterium]